MNGTVLLMLVSPMIIPLTFALPPVVCALLLHLDDARQAR